MLVAAGRHRPVDTGRHVLRRHAHRRRRRGLNSRLGVALLACLGSRRRCRPGRLPRRDLQAEPAHRDARRRPDLSSPGASKYSRGVVQGGKRAGSSASWAARKPLGVSAIFWTGAGITIVVALILRYTAAGRRFQVVGANPRAAWMAASACARTSLSRTSQPACSIATAAVLLAGVRISIDPASAPSTCWRRLRRS